MAGGTKKLNTKSDGGPSVTHHSSLESEHGAEASDLLPRVSWCEEGLDKDQCLAQVDRLISSPLLQGSEALCKLLQYLADHSLRSPVSHLKEYQIATEVFGRPSGFDPQTDSSVRVQIARLRNKLSEYYKSATDDPILIDVIKGRYGVCFQRRVLPAEAPHEPEAPSSVTTRVPWTRERIREIVITLASGILAGLLAYWWFAHPVSAGVDSHNRAPASLQTFWNPFLRSPDEPFVVFSNAKFVGTAITGMRYYDRSKDSGGVVTQHYTGVGEVMGVLELDRVFQQFGRQFRTKRGGLFTLDDARSNSLIFVGSPTENLTLGQLPNTREFAFREVELAPDQRPEVIVDLHPKAGEQGIYRRSPPMGPLESDYAVIALMHGLNPTRWTLILAGTSTIGTQAAVDYVSDKNSVEVLLRGLNVGDGGEVRPFEALLKVKIANEVPLETQIVSLRKTE